MKIPLTALVAVSVTLAHSAEEGDRIINGDDSPWEVPHFVALMSGADPFCGGTYIDSKTILTAAHCVTDDGVKSGVDGMSLRFGERDRNDKKKPSWEQNRKIVKVDWIHSYNASTLENDVGVVCIDDPVPIVKGKVEYGIVDHKKVADESDVTAVGFGRYRATLSDTPRVLQTITYKKKSDSICLKEMGVDKHGNDNFIPESMLCAGAPKFARRICSGDSGGPLVRTKSIKKTKCTDHEGTKKEIDCTIGTGNQVIGISSWGINCAKNDVYARVSAYKQEIKAMIDFCQKGKGSDLLKLNTKKSTTSASHRPVPLPAVMIAALWAKLAAW